MDEHLTPLERAEKNFTKQLTLTQGSRKFIIWAKHRGSGILGRGNSAKVWKIKDCGPFIEAQIGLSILIQLGFKARSGQHSFPLAPGQF